jgi:short-subunit dehydrogenase
MSLALITGASKGIGKAMAEELAKKKIDVLLIARSEDLLKEITSHLSSSYQIFADYLPLDLTEPEAARKIIEWCEQKNYRINILINNAGYGLSGAFENYSLKEHLDVMRINMNIPVELCYSFLPVLHQHTQSYILNIASSTAFQAVPGLSIYAASKVFLLNFSRALRYELRKTNVSVTVVSPGSTDTDFPNRANVSSKALKMAKKVNMTPEKVARIAIKAMLAKKTETTTGFINKLGKFLVYLAPKKISEKTAAGIYEV